MNTLTLENDFLRTFAPYVVVAPQSKQLRNEMETVKAELRELTSIRDEMFKFEDKTAINAKIEPVYRRYKELMIAKAGYPEKLSLDAFTLRRADGLPTFMMLNIDERERIFGIQVDNSGRKSFTHYSIPDVVRGKMQDVVNLMYGKTRGWFAPTSVSIHAELSGHIPDDVRPLIKKAKEAKLPDSWTLFDKIFIIAEAPEWKWNEMPVAKTDPLVVGYEYWIKEFFLITVYDPTDLEKYLAEQYTHTF